MLLVKLAHATDPTSTSQGSEAGTHKARLYIPPPIDALPSGFSLRLLGGYGMVVPFKLDNRTESEGLKPIGPALGVRASYLLQPGFVISTNVINYFEELNSESRGMTTIMLELGWAFAFGPVVIEPLVGIGPTLQRYTVSLCHIIYGCSAINQSEMRIGASVGMGVSTRLNDRWFLGGTAMLLGTVGPMLSVSGFATAGLRL